MKTWNDLGIWPNGVQPTRQLASAFTPENGTFRLSVADAGAEPRKLDLGSVAHCNNDHGISFDGKMLAISSSRQGMTGGGSTVYVLPLTGGIPKLVTDSTPSYWHGWAPGKDGPHRIRTYALAEEIPPAVLARPR